MPNKKKLLGYVGVDSGQLLIADPCYIDSEWKKREFIDLRLYKHVKTGELFSYGKIAKKYLPKGSKTPIPFKHYQEKFYKRKTMCDLLDAKEAEEVKIPYKEKIKGEFSYAGCCELTIADGHQLKFSRGHDGAGVAFRSGYGDGTYPVYGHFNEDGRCVKVEVIMN